MNPLNNCRGQVAVFYALLVPIFLFLGGVGLDLGWYYLNVSLIQNAADAAVIVGDNKLIETHTRSSENYKAKLVDKFPADKPDTTISTTAGDDVVKDYAKKNLEDNSTAYAPPNLFSVAQAADNDPIKDGYTRGDNTVDMTTELYRDGEDYFYVVGLSEDIHHFFIGFLPDMNAGVVSVALISKNIDDSGGGGDNIGSDDIEITFKPRGGTFNDGSSADVTKTYKNPATLTEEDDPQLITTDKGKPTRSDGNFVGWSYTNPDNVDKYTKIDIYYEGDTLTEERWNKIKENGGVLYAVYDPIDKVIPHNNKTLWEQMQYLIAKNVYHYYYGASEKKYGKEPIIKRFNNVKVYYDDISTQVWIKTNRRTDPYNSEKREYGHWETVIGKNRQYYAEVQDFDPNMKDDHNNEISKQTHYFIDFWQADNNLNFQDKDSRNQSVSASTERNIIGEDRYGTPCPRIHALFNVNGTYAVRSGYNNDDPLYFRIEAEPYKSETTPIRQIVININVDNTANGLRPLFFYYDGPDARATKNVEPGILRPDMAQPVILNLNADFKGVLWMPDIPVVINGNGHKFEGFIIAKEYRYLDTTQGTQVKYSTTGKNDGNYSDNDIHVDDNGNVYSLVAEGNSAEDNIALALWNNGNNVFGLNANSHFKTFNAASGVNYAYVYYDFDLNLDETAFRDDLTGQLIPLYKLEDGKQVRVTKWDDVNLYGEAENGTRKPIPKKITSDNLSTIKALTRSSKLKNSSKLDEFRGIVLLDGDDTNLTRDNNPIPLYDEAGNPVYFCEDYVKLTGSYNIFTLDTITEGEHGDPENSKEFLLTTKILNVSDTKEWI
ncbi:MAG: Tad domain-containing protein [Selenomonadaceae bacterium]|nr:Tad domain-containing protein [Selenomonadaceae bacterium]